MTTGEIISLKAADGLSGSGHFDAVVKICSDQIGRFDLEIRGFQAGSISEAPDVLRDKLFELGQEMARVFEHAGSLG